MAADSQNMPSQRDSIVPAADALTTANPEDQARYEKARSLAHQGQILRLVYSAKREGIFDDNVWLEVGDPTQPDHPPRTLRTAEALHNFIYNHNASKPLTVTLHDGNETTPLYDVSELWHGVLRANTKKHMGTHFSGCNWLLLQHELLDSLNNEALSIYAKLQMVEQFSESAKPYTNLWDWLKHESVTDTFPNHDVDSLLMQLGSFSGHRTHPSTKMRLQLEPDNQASRTSLTAIQKRNYFPEFAPDVALPVLAVRAERTTSTISAAHTEPFAAFFAESYPQAWEQWKASLANRVGNDHVADYVPIPVHPLQSPEIQHRFKQQIADEDILLLPGVTISQRPTLSFRTLTPVHNPAQPQIKTTLNMQMTSVVRTLAPARAYNAPIFSDILRQVVDSDPAISSYLRPVSEIASVYWGTDPNDKSKDYKDGYQLAAVFKSNPALLVQPDEIRVPTNTLLSLSPLSGERILIDIMRAAGVHDAQTACDYFAHYAQKVIRSDVGILARYGIGLESHQQNTDMVFDKNGQARAVVYRDINGGMDICEPMLNANGISVEGRLHPVLKGVFPDTDAVLRQTMHTTFMMHLFSIINVISETYQVPKQDLFALASDEVHETIRATREEHLPKLLANQPADKREEVKAAFEASLDEIEAGLTSRDLKTKCLLSMRVAQSPTEQFTEIENPMRHR